MTKIHPDEDSDSEDIEDSDSEDIEDSDAEDVEDSDPDDIEGSELILYPAMGGPDRGVLRAALLPLVAAVSSSSFSGTASRKLVKRGPR